MITRILERLKDDKWLRILVIVFVLSLVLGFSFQNIWGLNPNNEGDTILGNPDGRLNIAGNSTVAYSAVFNSNLYYVGFASIEPLQIYVVGEITSPINTSHLEEVSTVNELTNSFFQWYYEEGPITLVLNNTSEEPIEYRFEFRSYDENDLPALNNYGLGVLLYNLSFVCIGIAILWYGVIPRIPFLRRN